MQTRIDQQQLPVVFLYMRVPSCVWGPHMPWADLDFSLLSLFQAVLEVEVEEVEEVDVALYNHFFSAVAYQETALSNR